MYRVDFPVITCPMYVIPREGRNPDRMCIGDNRLRWITRLRGE